MHTDAHIHNKGGFTSLRGWAAVAMVPVLVWTVLAWRSGFFLPATARVEGFTEDGFSARKKLVRLPSGTVAYVDQGQGSPVVMLHGCPFSAFEWSGVLDALAQQHRVIVPDLRGLGDTPVSLDEDYRLPTDVVLVNELMDHLGVPSAAFVTHDHGGAVLQLLLASNPQRVERAIISNAEAYDFWPSKPEVPYLQLIVNPVTSPLMYAALHVEAVARRVFSIAVWNKDTLTPGVVNGWTLPHVANGVRWQRLRRFFAWQLDEEHQRVTMDAAPALKQFHQPVLLLWGARDKNFGRDVADRLAGDLSHSSTVWLDESGHMPMQEQPQVYATQVLAFLAGPQGGAP